MNNNFQIYYPELDFIKNHNEDFNSKLTKYFSIWHTLILQLQMVQKMIHQEISYRHMSIIKKKIKKII
jgi:hypothetical protein